MRDRAFLIDYRVWERSSAGEAKVPIMTANRRILSCIIKYTSKIFQLSTNHIRVKAQQATPHQIPDQKMFSASQAADHSNPGCQKLA